jgi:carbonic anhydrase
METAMSIIDQALKANERYAKTYNPKWGEGPPKPKIVVVTCMDPRLSGLPGILGLKQADIDVIRTGGAKRYRGCSGRADRIDAGAWQQRDHAPKSYWLRIYDFYRCRVKRQILQADWRRTPAPMHFFAFKDPEQQTKDQIKMVRSHPWISKEVPVRGFIFDVNTGRLREVMAYSEAAE